MDQHLEEVLTYIFTMTAIPKTILTVTFLRLIMFRVPTKSKTISKVPPISAGPQTEPTFE